MCSPTVQFQFSNSLTVRRFSDELRISHNDNALEVSDNIALARFRAISWFRGSPRGEPPICTGCALWHFATGPGVHDAATAALFPFPCRSTPTTAAFPEAATNSFPTRTWIYSTATIDSFPGPSVVTTIDSFPGPTVVTTIDSFPGPCFVTTIDSFAATIRIYSASFILFPRTPIASSPAAVTISLATIPRIYYAAADSDSTILPFSSSPSDSSIATISSLLKCPSCFNSPKDVPLIEL
ncbi:uncharacterized protein LOC130138788 [Syzygium oleosum]|uniref:uncharacterized protein LOC130138788 n=1 Tax=Syzygium oleosum TaxID=219896 RepID=UPI0024B95C41|nr:uncharacterized protein LOC130138788 [Syzygium oleosum]